MKIQVVILLFIFCLTASFQCQKKCGPGELRLDDSKSWLPLKGKTQLTFLDESNISTNFNILVRDSVETTVNYDCDAISIYESINVILYLSPLNNDDLIVFRLNPPNIFSANAYSTNLPFFSVKNVFKSANEGIIAKRFNNYNVGNRSYTEVILLLQNPKTQCPIDSILLAKNFGIVGFNNFAKKYTLQ